MSHLSSLPQASLISGRVKRGLWPVLFPNFKKHDTACGLIVLKITTKSPALNIRNPIIVD